MLCLCLDFRLSVCDIRLILPSALFNFLHDEGHYVLSILAGAETCIISELLSEFVGDTRAAAGKDYLVTETFSFKEFFHLCKLDDVDILLGYCLGYEDSISVNFLCLCDEFFARNLGTHVVRYYVLESLKTEVTVEALHLYDSIDTYRMSVRLDGSTYYDDISSDVLADPFAALHTVHNGTFYLRNVDRGVIDRLLS